MKGISLFLALSAMPFLQSEVRTLAFSGSTRSDSFNQKLVSLAADAAKKEGATVSLIHLTDYSLPFYDGDLETKVGMPEKGKELKKLFSENDLILISSPEYNGSLSGILKNLIDWMSRDGRGNPSRQAFQGKTFVLMSASPGPGGGKQGLEHLRMILTRLGGRVVAGEVTLSHADQAFNGSQLKDAEWGQKLDHLVKQGIEEAKKKD